MRAALSAARAVGAMAGVFPAAVRMSIDCLLVNTGSAWAGGPVYAFKNPLAQSAYVEMLNRLS